MHEKYGWCQFCFCFVFFVFGALKSILMLSCVQVFRATNHLVYLSVLFHQTAHKISGKDIQLADVIIKSKMKWSLVCLTWFGVDFLLKCSMKSQSNREWWKERMARAFIYLFFILKRNRRRLVFNSYEEDPRPLKASVDDVKISTSWKCQTAYIRTCTILFVSFFCSFCLFTHDKITDLRAACNMGFKSKSPFVWQT